MTGVQTCALPIYPGLQPFHKPGSQFQSPQSQSVLPMQPPKLGYIPLSASPISAESEIHKETVAPPLNNLNNQRPNNYGKEKMNVTGVSLIPPVDLPLKNNRPKQQQPQPQQSTNKQIVSSGSPINENSGKNRIHFPAGKPESSEEINGNVNKEPVAMLPNRFPNLLPHLFKQSTINNGPHTNINQQGSNQKRPPMNNKKPSWPSMGPQVRPGPQHKPISDANRFAIPTSQPEFSISTTSIDLLRLTKPTTEKDIAHSPATAFNIPSSSSPAPSSLIPFSPSSSTSSDPTSSYAPQIPLSSTVKPSDLLPVNKPLTDNKFDEAISDPFFAQVLNQTSKQPGVSEPVKPLDEKTDSPTGMAPSLWDTLRVSGCNIYGTFYKVDQVIDELSSSCKKCFCSSFGVQCNKVC